MHIPIILKRRRILVGHICGIKVDLSFKPLARHFPWQLLTDVCEVLHLGKHGYHIFHKHLNKKEPVVPFQALFCVALCQVHHFTISISLFKSASHLDSDASELILLTSAVISSHTGNVGKAGCLTCSKGPWLEMNGQCCSYVVCAVAIQIKVLFLSLLL